MKQIEKSINFAKLTAAVGYLFETVIDLQKTVAEPQPPLS